MGEGARRLAYTTSRTTQPGGAITVAAPTGAISAVSDISAVCGAELAGKTDKGPIPGGISRGPRGHRGRRRAGVGAGIGAGPAAFRAQAATSCSSPTYTASTITMISRVHPVRLPPKTTKSPATITPTIRRPLRCSRIQPAGDGPGSTRPRRARRARRPTTARAPGRPPTGRRRRWSCGSTRRSGPAGDPAAEGDQYRDQEGPSQVRFEEAQHGVPHGGGALRLGASAGGLTDEDAAARRQRA